LWKLPADTVQCWNESDEYSRVCQSIDEDWDKGGEGTESNGKTKKSPIQEIDNDIMTEMFLNLNLEGRRHNQIVL
jgi:hypothetical protein